MASGMAYWWAPWGWEVEASRLRLVPRSGSSRVLQWALYGETPKSPGAARYTTGTVAASRYPPTLAVRRALARRSGALPEWAMTPLFSEEVTCEQVPGV